MWRIAWALLVPLAGLVGAAGDDYLRARRKLEMIETDRVAPGSRILFDARELNAYVAAEIPKVAPSGVRNPRIQLGQGSASGSALIDFVRLRQARGGAKGGVLDWFLSGERPVSVQARIRSAEGRATVDIERVELSGIPIAGAALDFLIRGFLLPLYPDAKIGVPFELRHRVDRLEIRPEGVGVIIRR